MSVRSTSHSVRLCEGTVPVTRKATIVGSASTNAPKKNCFGRTSDVRTPQAMESSAQSRRDEAEGMVGAPSDAPHHAQHAHARRLDQRSSCPRTPALPVASTKPRWKASSTCLMSVFFGYTPTTLTRGKKFRRTGNVGVANTMRHEVDSVDDVDSVDALASLASTSLLALEQANTTTPSALTQARFPC